MVKLRLTSSIPLLLTLVVITFGAQVWLPNAYAVVCHVQITGVEYASTVSPGQTLEVKTHLMITCSPVNDNVLARVDIVSVDSNRTISSNSYGIGPIEIQQAPFVKVVNVTVSNTLQAPSTAGDWKLQLVAWVFAGSYGVVAVARQPIQVQVGKPVQVTSTATTQSVQSLTSVSTSVSTAPSFNTFEAIGLVVAVALIASVMVFMRRRRPQTAVMKQESVEREEAEQKVPTARPVVAPLQNISTGYSDLDTVLSGGLPVGYAILIVSPPCDERDLLLRKIIESGLSVGNSLFFLSRDLGRTQDLARQYTTNFYAFSPQAGKISTEHGNVFKLSGVQNLNDVNISFSKATETLGQGSKNKVIIMDILSDVLLEHKALTTRKWLDDFVAKRKAEGFTILGTLNPLIASKQESQTIIDLFDGIIEIYEKELRERARRFLIVKKMYGRKYVETELMLDKDKLF